MNAWRKTIGDRTTACIILATIDHGLAENAERVLLTTNGLTEVSIGFAKLICYDFKQLDTLNTIRPITEMPFLRYLRNIPWVSLINYLLFL